MQLIFRTAIFFVTCYGVTGLRLRGEDSVLRTHDDGQIIEILEDGVPVLAYQIAEKSLDGAWPRAGYVHPLYDLNGQAFTEDFPEDHRHHRGVFWAWHHFSVDGQMLGDPWLCKDFVRDCVKTKTTVMRSRGKPCARIDLITLWKSPLLKDSVGEMMPIVKEEAHIAVHASESRRRTIDFDIALTAMLPNVKIGGSDDVKGYGGFSPRIKLNPKQVFRFRSGEVAPMKTAVQGGPWIDISDPQRGMAIMSHPDNPIAQQSTGQSDSNKGKSDLVRSAAMSAPLWILRRKRSMQNVAYPGRTPVPLSTKVPLRLRYRLVIHDGKLSVSDLQAVYDEFANGK